MPPPRSAQIGVDSHRGRWQTNPDPGRVAPQPLALSVLAICSSADFAASATELFLVAIDSSAFCSTLLLSTLAQFGVFGTNQVSLAASPVDLFACACASYTESSEVVFGIANLASAVWLTVSV